MLGLSQSKYDFDGRKYVNCKSNSKLAMKESFAMTSKWSRNYNETMCVGRTHCPN